MESTNMSELTPEQRTKLRDKADAATAGPWRTTGWTGRHTVASVNADIASVLGPDRAKNAVYIAAVSPEVVLSMLDALDVKDAEITRLRETLASMRALHPPVKGAF